MIEKIINKHFNIIKYVIWAIGVALLLSEFFYGRSMWTDEAKLAINILDKSFLELSQSLSYHQSAPILFLWLAKLVQTVFGNSDLALRLAPLTLGVCSIPLFSNVLEGLLRQKTNVLLGLLFFVLNSMFLYYSIEFKQYIGDLFVWNLLFAIYYSKQKNKWFWLGWIGALSFFLSNATIIFISTIMVITIFKEGKSILRNREIIIASVKWLIFSILFYFLVVYHNPLKKFMLEFWEDYFPPRNVLSWEYWDFVFATSSANIGYFLGKSNLMYVILLVVSILGFVIGKKKEGLFLLLTPLVIHQLLSYFKLYPFFDRFLVYTIPLLIISILWASELIVESIKESNIKKRIRVNAFLTIICIVVFASGFTNFKSSPKEELVSALNVVETNKQTEDVVYVYYGSKFAMMRYESVFQFEHVHYGQIHRDENEKYLPEIDSLIAQQPRVWFVFSHIYPWEGKPTEPDVFKDHLNTKGSITMDTKFYGSRVFLFELEK